MYDPKSYHYYIYLTWALSTYVVDAITTYGFTEHCALANYLLVSYVGMG